MPGLREWVSDGCFLSAEARRAFGSLGDDHSAPDRLPVRPADDPAW